MKTIILTGGGTAGHVTPNLALIPSLKEAGYEIRYIGSYNGIERKLIENAGIPYDGISSGKLRRYFDLKNFSDPFRVLKGYGEARKLIKKYKPVYPSFSSQADHPGHRRQPWLRKGKPGCTQYSPAAPGEIPSDPHMRKGEPGRIPHRHSRLCPV